MALTSTLFTGLSGLDVNQTRLNVVGNNIANVNTVAFKSSRALFKPQFYVTDAGGSPPSSEFGGTNPTQRGLGAVVATIQKNFTPGSIEPTGKDTDMAIEGDGFFVVQSASGQRYTRDGSFSLNSANQLVTNGGDFVQGYGVDDDHQIIPGQLSNVVIPLGTATSAKATEGVTLTGNLNADGTQAAGASVLTSTAMVLRTGSGFGALNGTTPLTELAAAGTPGTQIFQVGDVLTLAARKGGRAMTPETLTVTAATTAQDLTDFFQRSMGIFPEGAGAASVPDDGNASTPAPGVTLDTATTPGQLSLVITGNLGAENALSITGSAFTNSSAASPITFSDAANSSPTGESVHTSFVVYDSLGTPLTVNLTAVLESKANSGNTWRFYAESADSTDGFRALGTGTLTFDNQGKLQSSSGDTISLTRSGTGALSPLAMKLDFASMTSLTSRDSELVMTEQDGSPIGTLNSFSIGADGTITGSYSNGLTQQLGQVAIAMFSNPQGLIDKGGNMYTTGPGSGVPMITPPMSLGAGAIRAGSLELSNVDLSKEFIDLIISSTGFSAASRVITTSDQLLTELLNASR